MTSDRPIASDGLIARATGPWAKEKLKNLDRYVGMVTTAMRRKFVGGVVFVDLMAGPGQCIDVRSHDREEFPGSTLRVLETRFPVRAIVAIENDRLNIAALKARIARHERADLCQLVTDDCNSPTVIEAVRTITDRAITVMFVDLLGTEVHMQTLRELTRDRVVDMLITWPEMDVVRNRGQMLEQASRWTAFFGSDAWQRIVTEAGPARRLRNLQLLYAKELGQFGYRSRFIGSVKNLRGRALYRPLFATRNERGLDFWTKASTRLPEQSSLGFD
jgi:three-Cys-motif partner protein